MVIVSILIVSVFTVTLCIIEVPKMFKEKLYKELWIFSILLAIGTALAILKSLDVDIPNPSDFVAKIYSPVSDVLKSFMK